MYTSRDEPSVRTNTYCQPSGFFASAPYPAVNDTYLSVSNNCADSKNIYSSIFLAKNNNSHYYPNYLLLTPAIFGTAAAFILGFRLDCLTSGQSRIIFFLNIYTAVSVWGAGLYIYDLLRNASDSFRAVILPVLIIILFFASVFNLIFSLFPGTFTGTIGDTPITQFLSFLALSIGNGSIGVSYNINPETAGVQVLMAFEPLFNLFVLTLFLC